MSPASGGRPANTDHSAKSKDSLGESHNLLCFRSPATGKAERPGFGAHLWRGGVSSQVGEARSVTFILSSLNTHWNKAEPGGEGPEST